MLARPHWIKNETLAVFKLKNFKMQINCLGHIFNISQYLQIIFGFTDGNLTERSFIVLKATFA
jgi:hypothetical protein